MILHKKVVSLNNIYKNESHWLCTLQIYTVCKSRLEISHRLMEMFLILKRLEDNLITPMVFLKMYLLKR